MTNRDILKEDTFVEIAESISTLSRCRRSQVGAILVREGRIISTGYNGTLPGFKNECEDGGVTIPSVMHAEQNVISYCAQQGISTKGATMYVTHSPCPDCAKLIVQAGINKVIFVHEYRDPTGIAILGQSSIPVRSWSDQHRDKDHPRQGYLSL